MSHAIRVHEYGGPEVSNGEGRGGSARSRRGQDQADGDRPQLYRRLHAHGLYPQSSLPFVPGMEGASVVTEVGEGVRDLKVGRRVAYAGLSGAYAEERLIAADRVVKTSRKYHRPIAAAIMLKGMTAQYSCAAPTRSGRRPRFCFMPPPAASASSPANGPLRSAQP